MEGIKAETLISLMDINEGIDVRMQGVFSRNYSEDLIRVSNEEVELSHNGIFHLLPEGLFFEKNRIKNIPKAEFTEKYKQFEIEKETIKSFFRPFDIEYFRLNLELERKLNAIAEQGNKIFFIKDFFDISEIDENNTYISKIKTILPFVGFLRGNLALLTDILKNILSVEKVEIKKEKTLYLKFVIHKEGLFKEEYQSMDGNLSVFFDFFCQWFLPIEAKYDYQIKDYKNPFILGNTLLLDYNTHL